MVLDSFVLEHAPGPVVDLHPAVAGAREALRSALAVMGGISDDRLTSAWSWDGNGVDVRYGFYRTLELLESSASQVARALTGAASSEARDAVGATTAARWDLQGIVAGLTEVDLDAEPGGGEWTVRQTLGHIIGGQRGYAWGSAWWISVRDRPLSAPPVRAPEEAFAALPSDGDEGRGTLAEVSRRLDDVVDGACSRYATLTDGEMAVAAGWSGFPVTIGFRMWRWPSHIAEHTVQVDKTLDMLGRRATEVQRLVRLNARAYGRIEALVLGRPSEQLDAVSAGMAFDRLAATLSELAPSVRAAAGAGAPAEEW